MSGLDKYQSGGKSTSDNVSEDRKPVNKADQVDKNPKKPDQVDKNPKKPGGCLKMVGIIILFFVCFAALGKLAFTIKKDYQMPDTVFEYKANDRTVVITADLLSCNEQSYITSERSDDGSFVVTIARSNPVHTRFYNDRQPPKLVDVISKREEERLAQGGCIKLYSAELYAAKTYQGTPQEAELPLKVIGKLYSRVGETKLFGGEYEVKASGINTSKTSEKKRLYVTLVLERQAP